MILQRPQGHSISHQEVIQLLTFSGLEGWPAYRGEDLLQNAPIGLISPSIKLKAESVFLICLSFARATPILGVRMIF